MPDSFTLKGRDLEIDPTFHIFLSNTSIFASRWDPSMCGCCVQLLERAYIVTDHDTNVKMGLLYLSTFGSQRCRVAPPPTVSGTL